MHMSVTWDDRLITRHHAADMAGAWDLKLDHPYLRCGLCDGNVTMLPREAGKLINIDGIIALVVGHMVRNHGYSLSGSGEHGD